MGEESEGTFTARTVVAAAELLGGRRQCPEPPRGFLAVEFGYAGQPESFARKLREVLDDDN